MECPICLEDLKNKCVLKTRCNHSFCLDCFINFTNTICPLCRYDYEKHLPTKLISLIHNSNQTQPLSNTPNINNPNDFPPLG